MTLALDKVACFAKKSGNVLCEILVDEQLMASDVLQLELRFRNSVTDFVVSRTEQTGAGIVFRGFFSSLCAIEMSGGVMGILSC